MQLKETKKALQIFAKNVVKFSRSNLTRKKKNVSKELYDSIGYDLKVHKNSFSLLFEMEDYGDFQDKGIGGKTSSYTGLGSARKGERIPRFKDKMPPREPILKWINSRRLRLRDKKTGKFKQGGQNTLAFLIQRSIYKKGIKPSLFFTKPFEASFKNLPDDLIEKFALDLENIITG